MALDFQRLLKNVTHDQDNSCVLPGGTGSSGDLLVWLWLCLYVLPWRCSMKYDSYRDYGESCNVEHPVPPYDPTTYAEE